MYQLGFFFKGVGPLDIEMWFYSSWKELVKMCCFIGSIVGGRVLVCSAAELETYLSVHGSCLLSLPSQALLL